MRSKACALRRWLFLASVLNGTRADDALFPWFGRATCRRRGSKPIKAFCAGCSSTRDPIRKKEKPDNRSGLFHTCAPENKVRKHRQTISFPVFSASHQFWGQRAFERRIGFLSCPPPGRRPGTSTRRWCLQKPQPRTHSWSPDSACSSSGSSDCRYAGSCRFYRRSPTS